MFNIVIMTWKKLEEKIMAAEREALCAGIRLGRAMGEADEKVRGIIIAVPPRQVGKQ